MDIVDIFSKYGEFCLICSGIPADTKVNEINEELK